MRAVVTSHKNPYLSGVARFNRILAARLGVPCVSMDDVDNLVEGPVLISVKLRDDIHAQMEVVRDFLDRLRGTGLAFDLFFHTFDGLEVEYALIELSRKVYCANAEILHALEGIDRPLVAAWCPALVNQRARVHEGTLNIFSFGMAHKIQVKYYRKLRTVLEGLGVDYSLWISTAFHEKANFGDFDAISQQLSDLFRDRIQFLGFLSDEAVNYFLDKSHLFIAFFESGVRANNTSVFAAMERGRAVLTNSDDRSPRWMRHGVNMLEIHDLVADDLRLDALEKIGLQARLDETIHAGWDQLCRLFAARVPAEALE